MHGSILALLKNYSDTRLGPQVWDTLLENAGLGRKVYLATLEYPDSEVAAIVEAASKATGKSVPAILDNFGQFIVPKLIEIYGAYVKPEWKTLDFLMNVEGTIHNLVRKRNPGANPAQLLCTRPTPDEVILKYSSGRKLCALAGGMIKGVAAHYNQRIAVSEGTCMNRGGPCCTFSIRLLS